MEIFDTITYVLGILLFTIVLVLVIFVCYAIMHGEEEQ